MLDGVSLDQLRAFIAAADEGSFSAGERRERKYDVDGYAQSLRSRSPLAVRARP
jgi:hypothetical protein